MTAKFFQYKQFSERRGLHVDPECFEQLLVCLDSAMEKIGDIRMLFLYFN